MTKKSNTGAVRIERTNTKCAGHSAWDRINLEGVTNSRAFYGKTERQAAELLGTSAMVLYKRFCFENNIKHEEEGVKLTFSLERYNKRKGV